MITYEDIKEIYSDIIEYWGEDIGGKIICAIHSAPKTNISYDEFFRYHCVACGGNWVAMVYTGIKSIAPTVAAEIPDEIKTPFKEFTILHNIAFLLGVTEKEVTPS